LYRPYLRKIEEIEASLEKLDSEYHKSITLFKTDGFRNKLKTGLKKVLGYNIISI
jgi:hypothetical protein